MNAWYHVAIGGSALLLLGLVSLIMKHEVKSNIARVGMGTSMLILALCAFHFNFGGANIVVKDSLWYSVASVGFVLVLQGVFSSISHKIMKRGINGDIIMALTGFIMYAVGLTVLLITGD